MQQGAHPICVQTQPRPNGEDGWPTPVMWCEVDTSLPMATRVIYAVQTGDLVPDNARYIGTVQISDGHYVIHFYDGGELAR